MKDSYSGEHLLKCLGDIQASVALSFNKRNTEMMVFGKISASLALYLKPTITNLKDQIDSDLKLDSHIKALVKSSFFHMRQLAEIKPVLQRRDFEKVIHTFLNIWL